jgi:hypothetical protein
MKRILWILILTTSFSFVYGQKSIDALFSKYAGNDGFVTFTLKGNLLKFLSSEIDEGEKCKWPEKITEIRILVQEDEGIRAENFYDLVMKDINLRDYEEFMRVKDSDQDLRMLVRTDGDFIREFLMIGGGEDNLIIQIRGKITFEEAENISSDVKKDHGMKMVTGLN